MAQIDDTERISWLWAIIFAFSFPELLTFLRAVRICFFKNVDTPTISQQFFVCLFEILHSIGLSILCFKILPELDAVKGIMLTNCLSFVPAVLGKLLFLFFFILKKPQIANSTHLYLTGFCNSLSQKNFRSLLLDTLAISAQVTGFVVWPLMSGDVKLWLIPVAIILISARWWENYASEESFLGSYKYADIMYVLTSASE